MQQLHLVGFTTDLEGLIFSVRKGAKSGGYLVLLDDRLRATVEDALRLRNGQSDDGGDGEEGGGSGSRPRRPRPESTLSPREIQARLRSGSTIAEVAHEAGVDEDWVSRFAVPIEAEQAQVVGRARRLVFVKPRLGESSLPLGTAVRWNLADKGVLFFDEDYDAAWSAYNLQGASWVVRFEYVSRQKRQFAEWEVDLREDELFARNRTASELAYVDAARRRRRPPALEPSPRETPARPVDRPRAVASRRDEPAPAPAAESVESSPVARSAGSAGPVQARTGAAKTSTASKAAKAAKASTTGRAAKAGKAAKAAKASKAARVTRASKVAKASTTGRAAKANRAGKPAKASKVAKAGKSGKATASRKAASAKRGRAQKPAGKKRGRADHAAASPAAVAAAPVSPPVPAEEPVRASHLARPPSPMPTARRATSLPLHTPRPVPPRPAPVTARRPAPAPPPPEPEPDADSAGGDLEFTLDVEPERPSRKPAPAPAPTAPSTAPPTPRAMGEGVRVIGRPERVNGDAPAFATAPRRRRPPGPPAADEARSDTPERKLARRLAGAPAGTEGATGRSRRPAPIVEPTEPEPVWHGPGSGEPAPAVRIRADLAAGTRRPAEAPEPPPGQPAASDVGAAPRRRRERPLRAR